MINVIAGTSILVLAILFIRKIFWKKCSPNVLYFLWIFVAFRILVPVNMPLELPDNSFSRMLVMDYGVGNEYERNMFSESESMSGPGVNVGDTDITDKNGKANISEAIEDDDRRNIGEITGESDEAEEHVKKHIDEVIKEDTQNEFSEASDENNKGNVKEQNEDTDNSNVVNQVGIQSVTKIFTGVKNIILSRAVLMTVWFTGSFFLAVYFLFANKNLFKNVEKKKIGIAEGNIEVFEVDGYNCLRGIRKPQIFLSSEIAKNPVYKEYVLMHELEHYRTKDNFWLLIGTICLTVQWFNPFVWIAYFKMREDCELACDYRVLSKLKKEEKSDYGKALLYILETNQKTVSMASPMGREKKIIKKRIESIFKKRKAEAYLIPLATACIVMVLAFVQPTLVRGTQQAENGTELANTEAMEQEEIIPVSQETEQEQNENSPVLHNPDSAEEVTEKEYELLVENKKDVERGSNLHYSNCYTTNMERGSNHFWIDENNILWGDGTSEYGQLGILKEDLNVVDEPVKIAENVIHVDFSGEYFVIYLTADYELYGLGASPSGILTRFGMWNSSDADMEIITEPVLLMTNVVFARSGYTSIIALLENGDVYILGNNEHNLHYRNEYIAPQKIMEKAKYVTTYFHTYAAIDENDNLWVWGHNELGQCGKGVYTANVASPQKMMEDVDCVWMGQVGFNHTGAVEEHDNLIVLKKDGSFWGCGEGLGESRLVKGVNDLMNEETEVISTNRFCKVNIKEYVPPSLKGAELLWSEEELKEFLENSQVEYYVSHTEEEAVVSEFEEQTMQESEELERKTEEKERPSKEKVLNMRSAVTEGMSEEEIARITENIKVANQVMEEAYLYQSLFERLEDPEDLYWNYVDKKGEIQVGWDLSENHYIAASGLTLREYGEKYGTPIMTYNRFDADNFIDLMREMRDSLKSELLKSDFDNLINYTQLAKDTHDVEYMVEVYRILHDMDYFLFRYGIEDVGKYVDDISTISKYYGVLNIYE